MDSNPKVLILCNDFPPINSIGADRPNSWYLYFKEFGLDPVVVTKNWNSNGNTSFNDVSHSLEVESTKYGELIKTPRRKTPSIWFKNKFGTRFSVLRKSLTFIEKITSFRLGLFDQHYGIYLEAKKYIVKNKVALVITTGEPFILFRYGRKLQKKFDVQWIADYRDGWYLNHISALDSSILWKIIRKWELIHEKQLCIHADMITTVDPEMAGRIGKLIQKDVSVIYNGFWDYYQSSKVLHKETQKIIINHTGTLTVGQQIEVFLDALLILFKRNQLNKENFQFNLIGLEYFPKQMKRLEGYKEMIGEIIFTTPRLPKKEAIKMNLKADYLVNFTDPNLSAIYAKTYDYIACQKPILVIPGDKGLLDKLIEDNELGLTLNNSKEIKEFLQKEKFKRKLKTKNLDFFLRKNQAKIFAELIHNMN